MTGLRNSEALLYTERGKNWLAQFAPDEQELARRIVGSLTLVSHSEFERVIQSSLERQVTERVCPIAFFSVREVDETASYFDEYTDPKTGTVNALTAGADHGSEARVAAVIRNFCKTDPDRLLNHPSLEKMRSAKCRTVVLVDDFIGSGERTKSFIASLWRDPAIASWHSLKYIQLVVIAYSGTGRGIRIVRRHKARPEVVIERSCPTYREMPWGSHLRDAVLKLCEKVGSRTSMGYWWDGYGGELAALVFEHGCPDNVPAILWAPDKKSKPWRPLFPNRVILAGEKSVFPPEIVRGDPLITLLDIRQKKLALSGQLSRRGSLGETILLVLALIARGQRRQSTLSFATGLSQRECAAVIERCVKWGFLTGSRRLSARGHAELQAARSTGRLYPAVPERGADYYFPKQLRRATRG